MGATLVGDGATFRLWAPGAREVYIITGEHGGAGEPGWAPGDGDALVRRDDGTWTGFVPGLTDGSRYRFWVVGYGSTGFKRDPYARELTTDPAFPNADCIIRDPYGYPWHDQGWRPPRFDDLVIYQLHVGAFYAVDEEGHDTRERQPARFLDLLFRIDYLRELGVNAILPLPIQEFPGVFSLGYNGTDYFSPEMAYRVMDDVELRRYLGAANVLLARYDKPPLRLDQLRSGPDQLKCVIDLCHLAGLAVLLDVVYNHAGGGFDDQSLWFLDRRPKVGEPVANQEDSLYFTRSGWAGGLVFDYSKPFVRQFLIDNAKFFLEEYHVDGLRYDEVSVIDNHGGWFFCQDLTSTLRFAKPQAIQIAEYWNDHRWLAVRRPPSGMGFDAALADPLRDAIRDAVAAAAHGRDAFVSLDRVAGALYPPYGFPTASSAVQCVENHDVVYLGRSPRIASLADPGDSRSWYARSRARVATGMVLTAPGIPLLFMGQEILEDKQWSDNTAYFRHTLLWWDGLTAESAMHDHREFVRQLLRLRHEHAALRGDRVNVFHVHNENRVIAFHRWIDGEGRDLIVVASLNESTLPRYDLGFPLSGVWTELFNSDLYDHYPNPWVAGNAGSVVTRDVPAHGFPCTATVAIPANGLLIFAHRG
jgi:1,4-alpha-glucan branching enzyme